MFHALKIPQFWQKCLQSNQAWSSVCSIYLEIFQHIRVFDMRGHSHDVTSFEQHTGLHPKTITRVSGTDAFPAGYEQNINNTQHHLPGDIVIICAGTLGRILAVEWFLQNPNTTFLELGSYFDHKLFGKIFGAHGIDANKP